MPWVAAHNTRFNEGSANANKNALMIADFLCRHGFSAMSAAAILGNIQHEGMMNPWYWEEYNTPTQNYFETHLSEFVKVGYGLFQFTSPNKYINVNNVGLAGYAPHFSDVQGNASDGNAQMLFFNSDIHTGDWSSNQYGYYAPSFLDSSIAGFSKDISEFYPTPVNDFIAGKAAGQTIQEQIENLTGCFELQYEAPSEEPPDPDVPGDVGYRAKWSYWTRVYSAYYYYDFIKDRFDWPDSGGSSFSGSFKLMMYLKPIWKRRIF